VQSPREFNRREELLLALGTGSCRNEFCELDQPFELKRWTPNVLSKHITIGPDSDREKVVLNMVVMGGGDAVSARLKAAEAEALINRLGQARASLKEQVIPDLAPGAELDFTVVDPAWRTSTGATNASTGVEGLSLALRHSGYGWLAFLLPHAEARALGQWLLDNARQD
jgi:hypothetical protein